jgi:uncharacterized membrane protein YcfT
MTLGHDGLVLASRTPNPGCGRSRAANRGIRAELGRKEVVMTTQVHRFGTEDMQGRLPFVDYAKGLCILLVVMMHTTLGLGEALHGEGWLHKVVAFAKPFRMPDFFLVSGLFLARVINRDWRTYLDRKVVHFLYFYLLWFAIQSILRLPQIAPSGDPGALMKHLGLGLVDPFGTLWFIYILPVFFVVTKLLRRVPPMIVLAAAAALEIAHLQSDWTIPHEFARRYVYFLIGYLFAEDIFAFARKVTEHPGLALAALILWANVNDLVVWSGRSELPFVSLALGVAGAAAIVAIAAMLARYDILRIVRLMGQHSIVIYLAFFVPMILTRSILLKTNLLGMDIGTASAFATLLSIAMPLILYVYIRKSSLRFLFERPDWARLSDRPTELSPAR